jgi:hypothetical protein
MHRSRSCHGSQEPPALRGRGGRSEAAGSSSAREEVTADATEAITHTSGEPVPDGTPYRPTRTVAEAEESVPLAGNRTLAARALPKSLLLPSRRSSRVLSSSVLSFQSLRPPCKSVTAPTQSSRLPAIQQRHVPGRVQSPPASQSTLGACHTDSG